MKSIVLRFLRLLIAAALAFVVYGLLGFSLDRLSERFERGTSIRHALETALAFLAPITFGLLVVFALLMAFYWLLPKWFPRLRGDV